MALLLGSAAPAAAQLERVYGFELPEPGMPELSLWTGYVAKSDRQESFFGERRTRQGLWAHALEAEIGVTAQFALGGYLDAEQRDGTAFTYTQICASSAERCIGTWAQGSAIRGAPMR